MASRSKVILFCISLFLQSCNSIGFKKLNITPVTEEQLLSGGLLHRQPNVTIRNEKQPLIEELRGKIRVLTREGFLGGRDLNNTNVEKQLMFIFYHWLGYKQSGMAWINRIPYFLGTGNFDARDHRNRYMGEWDDVRIREQRIREQNDARNLIWTPHLEYYGGKPRVEFRLNDLFTVRDPLRDDRIRTGFVGNMTNKRLGNAPMVVYNSENSMIYRRNIVNLQQIVHRDHLFRDNGVTIELPESLHDKKTEFMDNLLNLFF